MFSIKKSYDNEYLKNIYKHEKLCHTVDGNPCYVLTITDNINEDDCIKFDGTNVSTKRCEK